VKRDRHKRYKQQKSGGGRLAALAILGVILIAVCGYLFLKTRPETARHVSPPVPPPTLQTTPSPPADQRAPQSGISVSPENIPKGNAPYPAETPLAPTAKPRSEQTPAKGRLAIIIDDMGSSVEEARSLANIGVPLTFSIIPGLRNYREVASFAASNGIETMIHIPMQSKGWPQRRLETNGLLLSMDDAAVTSRLEEFVREIPNAVGANNHMGSEYTEYEEKMRVVLGVLKSRGLFFIDSMTSAKTTGLRVAREMGIRSERRNVFLDNEQNQVYIQGQLNQAVLVARKTGAGIAICHPHPATIKALALLLPGLGKQGITLVPASRLVR
jgi:polysaccharide deacetylase 2 family uncharacterized protein YibQ